MKRITVDQVFAAVARRLGLDDVAAPTEVGNSL
jgi:hypothetical protein